ncbi:flbB [Aspergillus flavus]|uniref:FlbB n=1 Tax=Aspergillus flavus (strain ATCC 200026 / FGSC A1120 / IAM 13836 / NRRL 3357 / JCM 12722 / SRRC 167) TaxID=332952 RepID=A0A7U2MM32_ASPFN|nr:uncharacterized protein G4B84_005114 [Aspergillus flavus NRRL3357]KAF7620164.1 hypothetical protein AFLA_005476 [Aspergillus flavus NRRL3357]KAJ1713650.1 bZIP transcription factor FlbB [Aspergillus flavus]QMW29779.1 hypothetical protein G4B84_005114 [Aspergillus flavus NRRL3357]QRD86178.1 flbB [Aspergillus flavus]
MASLNEGVLPLEADALNRQNDELNGRQSQGSLMKASMGTEWFRFFGSGQKKVTRDGQPAKRRGPKPDSKPALTRRQELNRQAQRTHRERKEQYMRALETEVSRLREAYTQEISAANLTVHQHREMVRSLSEENNILKEILAAHGISYEAEVERRKAERTSTTNATYQSSPFASSSVGSQPTAVAQSVPSTQHAYTTPPTTISAPSSSLSPIVNGIEHIDVSPTQELSPQHQNYSAAPCDALATLDRIAPASRQPNQPPGIFENDPQLQIDFILTLESPCREHTDYLCRRSITEADDEDMPFSGHALMASCPPPSYIANTTHEQAYPHQTYDLPHANLTTLLNLSRQLVTDGQITPIMALQCLKNHEMYRSLTRDDVKIIIETLNTKVRCYGFGAVVEDFELMDCLSSVVGSRVDMGFSRAGDDTLYS